MGDIDFEEQLELERLEKERLEKEADHPKEKVDPDGTVYEWDSQKKAWFPKVDADFIANYQMNYGVETSSEGVTDEQKQADYYNYYQNYYAAQVQQEQVLNRQKTNDKEDTAEEVLGKLENLESNIQNEQGSTDQSTGYQTDSKEDMEKYTEEQKKEYNAYWNYYYGTEHHDYYSDCLAQFNETTDQSTSQETGKVDDGKKKKKRKAPTQDKREEGWFNIEEKDNTNVYVSGMPLDVNIEEFKELMTKYGLVMHDPRTKQPKLKLYFDENGQPKGDGRCCYIKKESVDLALSLLDGSDIRGHKVKVELAQFSMKGDFDPSKKKKKLTNKEKKKLKERQEKLFDWRPERPRGARMKNEKVVILKNIFDPKDFEDDPTKINTLRNEMRVECAKYGDVKKVVVFDRHLDGVVSVHFKEAEEADVCVQSLHQRWFAQRRVLAETWDGKTKYEVLETEEEREARLKKWETYLETGEHQSGAAGVGSTSSATESSTNNTVDNTGVSQTTSCESNSDIDGNSKHDSQTNTNTLENPDNLSSEKNQEAVQDNKETDISQSDTDGNTETKNADVEMENEDVNR